MRENGSKGMAGKMKSEKAKNSITPLDIFSKTIYNF